MGYFLMPQAEGRSINVREAVAEAIRVFAKSRKIVTDTHFHATFELERDVVTITNPATGDSESYTLVELGFF